MQFVFWVVYTYIVVSHWYCWPCNFNSSSIPNNWDCQHTHLSSSLWYLLPEYSLKSCLFAVSHRRRTWKVREGFPRGGRHIHHGHEVIVDLPCQFLVLLLCVICFTSTVFTYAAMMIAYLTLESPQLQRWWSLPEQHHSCPLTFGPFLVRPHSK